MAYEKHVGLKCAISFVAVGFAVLHGLFPEFTVDTATLILLALAVLPWLQPLVRSVKIPGGLEIELQAIREKSEIAAGAAESASLKADTALAEVAQDGMRVRAHGDSSRLMELAKRYERIRETVPSGDARTRQMTELVVEMMRQMPVDPAIDVESLLTSASPGNRLLAFAVLYTHPKPKLLALLARCGLQGELHAFGQYWALQAIGRNLPDDGNVEPSVVAALREFVNQTEPGSARHYESKRILKYLESVGQARRRRDPDAQ